jgi:hypothetical protein
MVLSRPKHQRDLAFQLADIVEGKASVPANLQKLKNEEIMLADVQQRDAGTCGNTTAV